MKLFDTETQSDNDGFGGLPILKLKLTRSQRIFSLNSHSFSGERKHRKGVSRENRSVCEWSVTSQRTDAIICNKVWKPSPA